MEMKVTGISYPLVPFTLLCLAIPPGGGACPLRCACHVPTEVHCTFRYLSSIPDDIPPNVERINLGYNNLVRLTETAFSGLNKLELLLLHSNGIHIIPAKTFLDLHALQVLKMSYNKVRELQKDTFYGLKNLTRLYMDHNNIEFINPEAFYGLTFLRLVHLEGNQLTKLHPDTFVSLRYLQIFKTSFIKSLYLSNNSLSSLPEEMVSYMSDLESLYLHGNPWICDCHLKWLSDWIQEKPDIIKCKRNRSPDTSQQCPLCMNPRTSKDRLLAMIPAAQFLCTKPTIDLSLKMKNLTNLEESDSVSIYSQDFRAPFGSVTLNMTDQSGNEANMICTVQRPLRTSSITFSEESDFIMLNTPFSTLLVCSIDDRDIQPAWQVLALYSNSPLILKRSYLLTDGPQPFYKYKQLTPKPEDVFTNIEADLRADPSWLMQDQISLQLNRAASTLSALQIRYSIDAQVMLPREETKSDKYKWTMISGNNTTNLEHTVLVGGTIDLDCPGQGDPIPHLEWLLADGNKVRAPYVSEDGRILIDKSGKLELQRADRFDTGIYRCISTNNDDADILTYRITVIEPYIGAYKENGAHHTVFTGETVDLPCHSSGNPDASVSWILPGNTVLYESSRNRQILNNGTLRILQITEKDQGHYCCVAANPSGVDFLINQVSVKRKGQRSMEDNAEADGSVLNEVAPTGAYAKKPTASTGKKHNWKSIYQQHRGSRSQYFKEHRRHFPFSAQRIDPQHWAALLKKAKKNTKPEKQERTTIRPLLPAPQLLEIHGKEPDSSGMYPPDEDFMVLATEAPNVLVRMVTTGSRNMSDSPVTNVTDTEDSPIASAQLLSPEKRTDFKPSIKTTAMLKDTNPTTSSKIQSTTNLNPPTLPPVSEVTEFQDTDLKKGRKREPLQSVPQIPLGTKIEYVNIKKLSSANTKAHIFLGSVNTRNEHQTSVTRVSEPSNSHVRSHITQKLSTSKVPPDPSMVVHSYLKIPRNSTTKFQLHRHFGRWKKIWGPYKTPLKGEHNYSFVRSTFIGSSEENTTAYPATEPTRVHPSYSPKERVTVTTGALSFPNSFPVTISETDVGRVTTKESTSLVYNPSLLRENKQNADIEKTTHTIKYLSTESAQMTPSGVVRSHTPISRFTEKAHITGVSYPSVSETSDTKRDSIISLPLPLPGPATNTSMPTTAASTRFLRRKIPWHRIVVKNQIAKEMLKKQHKFSFQSLTTVLSKTFPSLPTTKVSPFDFTTLSANVRYTPSIILATTHHNSTKSHVPTNLLEMKGLPSPLIYPILPTVSSESSTNFMSVQTVMPPESITINKPQIARPRARKIQMTKEPQKNRNDSSNTPGQASSFNTSSTIKRPFLTRAEIATKFRVSTFPHSLLGNTKGILSTIGVHPTILNPTNVVEKLLQENTQTLENTRDSETTLSSRLQQSTPTAAPASRHSAPLSFPNSGAAATPVLTATPLSDQNAIATSVVTPVSRMTNTVTKPYETSRHNVSLQQLAAEVATAHPNFTKSTNEASHFISSTLIQPTPLPALRKVKPLNSKLTPSPGSENYFGHKSYPETVEKDQRSVVSMSLTPGWPKHAVHSANSDGQKDAKKSGVDETLTQKITSELSFDPLSRDIFEKPRIVGGKAASFTVSANADAFLPCVAAGNPLPTIHWTRVSSGLALSREKQNSRFRVLPNGTLSIQRVDVQDRGQYLCSASNQFGTDHLRVTLSVVSYPPRILESQNKQIIVHSGRTMEVKCRAEGSPRPVISWILANQTVISESAQGSTGAAALVTSEGTLIIRNLSIYDRGAYKCMASNAAGQDSMLVKILVIAAPPVILEQKRQLIAGHWGESLEMPCTAQGTPQPSVYWVLSDGTEVKPLQLINSKLFLFSNGTLYIRNINSSDRGTYECIATSSTGSERRVVTLTVEERDTIPRIESASQEWTEVNLGDNLLLNCSASGEPKPQIIWRLPSKAIVDQWHRVGSHIHVYPNGSLFIATVTELDGGDYVCVARNKMGDDLTLMHVSLRLKPAKIDHKQHFIKRVFHGKDFQVDCKASGLPAPKISWSLPDGTVINKGMQADDSGRRTRRYTLFDNGTLYFSKVGITEEGDYTCFAQNTLGKDEMKVQLIVVTAAPRIRQGYKTQVRTSAGDTAFFDCEVTGEPKPKVFWMLPSSDIVSFSKDRYTFHSNGSLSIDSVKLADSGEYVCVARNPSGGDSKTHMLDVVSKPPLINARYANRTVMKATAVRHSRTHFDCKVEGTPSPQIMWIMPNNIFLLAPYYGSRITVHRNGTLEIRNVRLSDSADFTCVARSDGGESVLVVQLEVLDVLRRPTFRNPLNEKVVAQLGKTTALNCSVDGNPPPEILWVLPNGTRFPSGTENPHYLVASNGSFIIRKTTRDDAGNYRCAARNKVGYIEKLIVLEVGQKPVILTYARGTVSCIIGESLSLGCVAAGNPKPNIKWAVPTGYVIDRPQVNGKYILHKNGTLVIKAATTYDRGNYICHAQNSMGHALVTVPVRVVAAHPRVTQHVPRRIITRTGTAVQLH